MRLYQVHTHIDKSYKALMLLHICCGAEKEREPNRQRRSLYIRTETYSHRGVSDKPVVVECATELRKIESWRAA